MIAQSRFKKGKKYIGSLIECRKCHAEKHEYYFEDPENDESIVLCEKCMLELNPPQIELEITSAIIWNRTQKRFENTFTLKDFEECGWFLREETTSIPVQKIPRVISATILFEYFGKYKCLRVLNHKYFSLSMPVCCMTSCISG